MFVEKDFIDPTKPYTKMVMIDGKEYPVTVVPPEPEQHDETVWAQRRPKQPEPHVYDGLGAIQEYVMTHRDQSA